LLSAAAYLGLFAGEKSTFLTDKHKYGQYAVDFVKGSLLHKLYGESAGQRFKSKIYVPKEIFDRLPIRLSGICEDGSVAAYEKDGHRFFVGVFFRPEFLARPNSPSPVISAFLKSCINE